MFEKDLARAGRGIFKDQLLFLKKDGVKLGPQAVSLLFDPAKVAEAAENQFARGATVLEAVRNIFILVPILVTWLSLGLAATAYAQIAQANPTQPFLKLWADGFPGAQELAPSFSLVAGLDVSLLVFLLTITILIHLIEGSAAYRAAKLRVQLEKEILEIMKSAAHYSLVAGPGGQPPNWIGEVKTAMDNLTFAVNHFEGFVRASQNEITLLVQSSQQALESFMQTSRATIEGSSREFSRVLSDHRAAVTEFIDGTQDVRRTVDKLEVIYVEGQTIYRGLNQTMPGIQASFKVMADRQDQAATTLQSISGNNDKATEAVTHIAQQFVDTNLVESTSRASNQMRQAAKTVEDAAKNLEGVVKQQDLLQQQLNRLFATQTTRTTSKKRKWWKLWR